MNGCRVTLRSPTGKTSTQNVIITMGKGPNGGTAYRNSNGFHIEIVGEPGGVNNVVGFGWKDGDHGYEIDEVVPITNPA